MIFGKDTKEWESLKGIYTATEINQQPNTWKKTIKQGRGTQGRNQGIYRKRNETR